MNATKLTKKTGKVPRKNANHKRARLEARANRKAANEAARAPKPIEPLHSKSRGTSNTKPRRHGFGFRGGARADEPGLCPRAHDFAAEVRKNGETVLEIYQALWRPEEIGITRAEQLVKPLTEGLALLEADPDRFRAFNPENGWGDYDGLCDFVREYLDACIANPDAKVSASR